MVKVNTSPYAAYNRAANIAAKKAHQIFQNNVVEAQKKFNNIALASSSNAGNPTGDILSIVDNGLRKLKSTIYKANDISIAALTEEVDQVEFMATLNEADIALNLAKATRDTLVSSILDLLKMPI